MGFISSMGYSSFIKKKIKYWQYRIYSENVNPPLVIAQPKGIIILNQFSQLYG